jgi:hypothetical protein
LRVIGSDADAPLTTRQADLRGPVVIVVGSEGQGLGPAVRKRCDTLVRIPMLGHVSSLNASVAGSILLYEASSQRGVERPPVVSIFAPDAIPAATPSAALGAVPNAALGAVLDAVPKAGPAARKRRAKVAPADRLEPVVQPSDSADGESALLPGMSTPQPEPDSAE